MNKKEQHVMTGMTRDIAVQRVAPNLVVDARNIRISARKGNSTLLTVTNEKGTREFEVVGETMEGVVIGTATLNRTLVVFTTNGIVHKDNIYKLVFSEDLRYASCSVLFSGELNFDYTHPLETLPVYENSNIQKVYWVDGVNQPRFINICEGLQTNPDVFNFSRQVDKNHSLSVVKSNSGGEFNPGTIQFCFTYFNMYGQETPIIEASELFYLSPKTRGLSADAVDSSSFTLRLTNLDTSYKYARVYSIYRSSEGATPLVKILGDFEISIDGSYTITNTRLVQNNEYITLTTPPFTGWNVYEIGNIADCCFLKPSTGEISEIQFLESGQYRVLNFSVMQDTWLYNSRTGKVYKQVLPGSYTVGTTVTLVSYFGKYYLQKEVSSYLREGEAEMVNPVGSVTFVDNGTAGSTTDATALLFVGGVPIVAETLAQKDNTLFLGNISEQSHTIGDLTVLSSGARMPLKRYLLANNTPQSAYFDYNGVERYDNDLIGITGYTDDNKGVSGDTFYDYPIDNNRGSRSLKSFKYGENYRLGLIAQHKNGNWSDVIWLGDITEECLPSRMGYNSQGNLVKRYANPGFSTTLDLPVKEALLNAGFVRVAPVCVFPQGADRMVICQGLLSGTVFNVKDRSDNSPFVQADWRFRAGYSWGSIRHELQVDAWDEMFTRVSTSSYYSGHELPNYPFRRGSSFEDNFAEYFYRDPTIVTFHSPDIEFDDQFSDGDFNNTSLRIIGLSNGDGISKGLNTIYNVYEPLRRLGAVLETSTPGMDDEYNPSPIDFSGAGTLWYDRELNKEKTAVSHYVSASARIVDSMLGLSYPGYQDKRFVEYYPNGTIHSDSGSTTLKWKTYLWHRHGSMNNQPALDTQAEAAGTIRTAMLKHKCISELSYARTFFFHSGYNIDYKEISLQDCRIYNPDVPLIKLNVSGEEKTFYGEINKVINPSLVDNSGLSNDGYYYDPDDTTPTSYANTYCDGADKRNGYPVFLAYSGNNNDGADILAWSRILSKDPVHMKYKTSRSLVMALGDDTTVGSLWGNLNDLRYFYWMNNVSRPMEPVFPTIDDGTLPSSMSLNSAVLVADIVRHFSDEAFVSRFGGQTDQALQMNTWVVCGDSVVLDLDAPVTLDFREGDTYIGRYDCLKSYPFTQEDENSIVSIYSTEVESRVNLDFRYDKNRGLEDNTLVTPENFDLFNDGVYEQTNQYFTYRFVDVNRYKNLKYPNMITWSLEKVMGADVDTWTKINLTSTFDLDGDKGEITKLTTYKNEIFAFQNRGFAQILFNSRVQIPASDGNPIEITNGYKVSGKRYISDQIGVSNKWSVVSTPNGLYFIDDERDNLYRLGEGLEDLSSKLGFKTWLEDNNSYTVWNPVDFGNIRTVYDKTSAELYFLTSKEALVFSENQNAFISFMDYASLADMINIGDKFLTFQNDKNALQIHELWAGEYNMFFGEFKPFWMTFVANADPTCDKVFNNIEWRSITYTDTDGDKGILAPNTTFDTIRVWHEHQDTHNVPLKHTPGKPSVMTKKFNVFRAAIPRDRRGDWSPICRDRIRNTWAYIQLSRYHENQDLTIFTDLSVDYFE